MWVDTGGEQESRRQHRKQYAGEAAAPAAVHHPAAGQAHLCEREEHLFMRVAAVWRLAEPRCTRRSTSSAAWTGRQGET